MYQDFCFLLFAHGHIINCGIIIYSHPLEWKPANCTGKRFAGNFLSNVDKFVVKKGITAYCRLQEAIKKYSKLFQQL